MFMFVCCKLSLFWINWGNWGSLILILLYWVILKKIKFSFKNENEDMSILLGKENLWKLLLVLKLLNNNDIKYVYKLVFKK